MLFLLFRILSFCKWGSWTFVAVGGTPKAYRTHYQDIYIYLYLYMEIDRYMLRPEEEGCRRIPGPKSLQFRCSTWPAKRVLILQLDDASSDTELLTQPEQGRAAVLLQLQSQFTSQAKQHNRFHGNYFSQHSCVGQTHPPLTLLYITL